jgi:serine protease Do
MSASIVTGCASMFIPLKQKVTITTNNKNSKIYISNEEVGEGKSVQTKVEKNSSKQVVIKTENYKTEYYVLAQTNKRPAAFWPLTTIDWLTLYGGMVDAMNAQKFHMFPKYSTMEAKQPLIYKKNDEKHIDLDAIKIKVLNKDKDLQFFYVSSTVADFEKKAALVEEERIKADKKQEEKALKSKKKEKKKLLLDNDDSKIDYDDSKFTEAISKTLMKTNYIDTVNKVFSDNNNTLRLEGVIKKANVYYVSASFGYYRKVKINISWNVKNTFNEVIDSINLWSWSGDFTSLSTDETYKIYADAVEVSYYDLMKNKQFLSYLKLDTVVKISEPVLILKKPTIATLDMEQATNSTVTVKRKDGGHGSGFAITTDGYIITNYHVIAGKTAAKQSDITIVLSDGEEVPVKVVRYNKMRDIALLKVENKFETPFTLSNLKSYKKLMEIYTIGTPKSIELGQSVSIGLLSNERKANNNNLLQLSMSINGGNSGGPLFDKVGNLHGVVTSKLVGFSTEGVGFAIPSFMIPEYLNLKVE